MIQAISLAAVAGPIAGVFPAAVETDERGDARPVTIGRAAGSAICLVNEGVSRKHATLVPRDGSWHVVDHNSTGGTFLNGVRLVEGRAMVIRPGDLLKVGPCAFRITTPGGTVTGTDSSGVMGTLIDAGPESGRVERSSTAGLTSLAKSDRRLRLLSEGLARLSRINDEQQMAQAALEVALAGSGYRWGAVLRPGPSGREDQIEVVASLGAGMSALGGAPSFGALRGAHATPASPTANAPGTGIRTGFGGAAPTFSRSLVRQAMLGEIAVLTSERSSNVADYGQSIAEMRIHSAICAPVYLGEVVEGFLYLDSRGEAGTVSDDAAGFCDAVARAYGLAAANLKRAELQRRHSRLQTDLDAAREAQQMILPPSEGALQYLAYAVRSVPGQFVAGDMFNVIELPASAGVAVCLGDVAGHGVASALVMAALQAHLHAQLMTTGDPQAAVESLNDYLAARAAAGRFASLWVGVFSPDGRVRFVDAGHGHWLCQRRGESTTAANPRGSVPVGIMPDVQYPAMELRLDAGDRLVLYSDGIVEQRGSDGSPFGLERLHAAIAPPMTLTEVVSRVFGAVSAHAGVPGFDDDTSAAVIEFRG